VTPQPPPPDRLRDLATRAVRRLQEAGFVALWAGGCVRDLLLGQPPKDYDIATGAVPDQVLALFPGAHTVGKAFAVVRVPLEEVYFEVATFRQDHDYADGRHPSGVTFSDPPTDASRRDFTINALFYDPVTGRVHDYVGGQADLRSRVIRCVGDPAARFAEDHLRMLRAARFACTLDFRIEDGTSAAIRAGAAQLGRISAERVRDELVRILLESARPGDAVALLRDLGLLQVVLPEVAAMQGQAQPPEFHPEGDVFEHTVLMLNHMRERSEALALACLLHDTGKPLTAVAGPDRIRFDGHAARSAEVAESVLRRLRFPNDTVASVTAIVRNHMRFMDVKRMRESSLRRLVGAPTFPLELEMHRLDCLASHGDMDNHDFVTAFRRRIADEPVLPKAWITGHDLMRMGVPQGPAIGEWRKRAYDAQLEGSFTTPESLAEWIEEEIRRAASSGNAPL
jgi:poly(A) polymerase